MTTPIIAKILDKMHRDATKHITVPETKPTEIHYQGLTYLRPGKDAYGNRRVNDLPKSKLSQNFPDV